MLPQQGQLCWCVLGEDLMLELVLHWGGGAINTLIHARARVAHVWIENITGHAWCEAICGV